MERYKNPGAKPWARSCHWPGFCSDLALLLTTFVREMDAVPPLAALLSCQDVHAQASGNLRRCYESIVNGGLSEVCIDVCA